MLIHKKCCQPIEVFDKGKCSTFSGVHYIQVFRLTWLRVTYIHFSLAAFPPNFAKYPLLPNQYGTVQGNVTIMCRAEGAPRPEIVWFKDGGRLSVSEQPSARVRKLANGWLFINNVGFSSFPQH